MNYNGKAVGKRIKLVYQECCALQQEGFPVAQMVKNPSAMQETLIQSPDQEDSLEKEMATHSNILAWRIPWAKEPGGIQSTGLRRVWHN